MKKSASKHLVPCVLGAAVIGVSLVAGCQREGSGSASAAAPKADPPDVYMKDPVFQKALADKRQERNGILSVRRRLVEEAEKKVEAMKAKMPGADETAIKAELEKDPEWVSLIARVESANDAYNENRLATTKIVGERISSKKSSNSKPLKK